MEISNKPNDQTLINANPSVSLDHCSDTLRSITSTERKAIDDMDDINNESSKLPIKVNMSSNSIISNSKMLLPKLDLNPIHGRYHVMPNIKIAPEVKKTNNKTQDDNLSIVKESKKSLVILKKPKDDHSIKLLTKEYESTLDSLKDLKDKLEKQKRRNRELVIKHSSLAKNLKLATNKVEIIKDQIVMLGGSIMQDSMLTISEDSSISE